MFNTSMSHLYYNYSSLSRNLSLKVDSDSQTQFRSNAMPSGFQLLDHDSSSSQSTQSNSRDQCHEVGEGDTVGRMTPIYLMCHPDPTANIDYSPTITCMPYSCDGLYFNGLLSTYGPTQIMGITTARVPLPVDILDDGPIYVNAKQYNGILRRRETRARLHSQNKLIKARKPYLHESRHRHAVNRVRGRGGRFLSTKKLQQSDSTSAHCNNARGLLTGNVFYQRPSSSGPVMAEF
ncbi:hypothetical protein RND81_08G026700 [Saponaria officinalis]|uniref:Nuclear transcription factor Y subunit n=1 Tax=Saponaria officinalis TaxID=3572 RepID=A0AAW1J2W4_SAPOF